jgi:hypothetical protein
VCKLLLIPLKSFRFVRADGFINFDWAFVFLTTLKALMVVEQKRNILVQLKSSFTGN